MVAFERRIKRCREVRACAEIAGEVDYVLTVVVHDMREFAEFARRHLAADRRIKSFRSLLVLRQTKDEHMLPLEMGQL